MEEPFDLNVVGGKVRGFLRRPGEGGRMVVVILHGWIGYCAGPHRILYELAEALGEAGMGTVRFDFFGRGDSDGVYEDTTFSQAADDTRRVASYVRQRLGECTLAMAGMCFGATVGWRCMDLWDSMVLLSPERVRKQSPWTTRLAALGQQSRRIARTVASPRAWARLLSGQARPGVAYRFYTKSNALPYTPQLPPRPPGGNHRALVILGGADPAGAFIRRQYGSLNREFGVGCEVHVVPGADHSFCSVGWKQQAISQAADWLRRRQIEADLGERPWTVPSTTC